MKIAIAADHAGFETIGIEPVRRFRDEAIARMELDPARILLASAILPGIDAAYLQISFYLATSLRKLLVNGQRLLGICQRAVDGRGMPGPAALHEPTRFTSGIGGLIN